MGRCGSKCRGSLAWVLRHCQLTSIWTSTSAIEEAQDKLSKQDTFTEGSTKKSED